MKRFFILLAAAAALFTGAAEVNAAPPDSVSAKSAVLIEADTGQIVWAKNENTRLPMASTTKIMTALITLESGDLDEEFTVDSEAVKTEGSSMGLREGDIVSKRDLCIGMLLPSGNDAANCAAVRIAGSVPDFADMMNGKAYEMGLSSTHFVTPSGLHDDEHYSTAYDMAVLASYALKNPDFAQICGSSSMKLSYGCPPYDRRLVNTNKLLGKYPCCIGIKTGFTDEAGRCLVCAARKDGVTLICVTLNAPDDWNDHIKLFEYGFSAVSARDTGERRYEITAVGSDRDKAGLVTQRNVILPVINGKMPEVTYTAAVPSMVYAPAAKGSKAGVLKVMCGGRAVDEIPLLLEEDLVSVKGGPYRAGIAERITDFFKEALFG